MRRFYSAVSVVAACLFAWTLGAAEVKVYNANVPLILDRGYNIVAEICMESDGNEVFDGIDVNISGLPSGALRNVRLMYSGTMSASYSRTSSYILKDAFRRYGAGQTIYCNPSYVIESDKGKPDLSGNVSLSSGIGLRRGENWFYVSMEVHSGKIRTLSRPFNVTVTRISVDGRDVPFTSEGTSGHRLGIAVRQYGDDGAFAFRIPGLVTTNEGTLIAVYDIRHSSSSDLQDDIDIGMSRSTDGGLTWEKMRTIMDMGEYGGLPQAQNGIGDPAVLVDGKTGEIFVVAVWTHGLGNDRAWNLVGDGFTPEETAQLMITSSRDDGKTWSPLRNITRQVKKEHWRFTLQGPGRGISMDDGTIVFPVQYIDSTRVPNAGIMFSRDHGETWQCFGHAYTNTTESQVAEISPGVLMLNMRNNRRTGRIVCTTEDFGKTWSVHPSSEKLREPVCMAGLLMVKAEDNVLGKDILLFSNPDTVKGRNHITIKASLDHGDTWEERNSLMIDEEEGWGYSCMTMIDRETVGILYEGSASQLVFQAIRLTDIVK